MGYTIKQVSERTNLSEYVLRYYEKEGLLTDITRGENGFRVYTDEDLEALGLICCLKNTGMSIKQIREFVELSARGGETLRERCELLREHKHHVEEQMREMQRYLDKVSSKIACFTRQYEEYTAENSAQNTQSRVS